MSRQCCAGRGLWWVPVIPREASTWRSKGRGAHLLGACQTKGLLSLVCSVALLLQGGGCLPTPQGIGLLLGGLYSCWQQQVLEAPSKFKEYEVRASQRCLRVFLVHLGFLSVCFYAE